MRIILSVTFCFSFCATDLIVSRHQNTLTSAELLLAFDYDEMLQDDSSEDADSEADRRQKGLEKLSTMRKGMLQLL